MTTDKQARKERPIARGFFDYFPRAIAEVAHASYVGNQQHNPGQPLHWAREKSNDHADCIGRHFIERGTMDSDGLRHSAKLAWRAMALLELELEAEEKPTLEQNVKQKLREIFTDLEPPVDGQIVIGTGLNQYTLVGQAAEDYKLLTTVLGCPWRIAEQIVRGTTYCPCMVRGKNVSMYVYLAGPMRGYPQFNFPAFDLVRGELVKRGYNVISPADIDRGAGDTDEKTGVKDDQATYALRDFWALYFLRRQGRDNAIVMMPNWERSTGASAEYKIAQWVGLQLMYVLADFPQIAAVLSDQKLKSGSLCEQNVSCGKALFSPTGMGDGM